jgi:hypothetical protein
MDSNISLANTVSITLCEKISASFHIHTSDRPLLNQFINLGALEKVLDFLQSATRTRESMEAWAQMAYKWTDDHTRFRHSAEQQLALSRLFNVAVIVPPDETIDEGLSPVIESHDGMQMLSPIVEGLESLPSTAHAFLEPELPSDTWEPQIPRSDGSEGLGLYDIEYVARTTGDMSASEHLVDSARHSEDTHQGIFINDVHPGENTSGSYLEQYARPLSPIPINSTADPFRFSFDGPMPGFTHWSPHDVLYQNKLYPSAYHLVEALKFLQSHPDLAEQIRLCTSVDDVHKLSSTLEEHVQSDWDQVFMAKASVVFHP